MEGKAILFLSTAHVNLVRYIYIYIYAVVTVGRIHVCVKTEATDRQEGRQASVQVIFHVILLNLVGSSS